MCEKIKLEEMSGCQTRAAKRLLGTEDIGGRHVNCVPQNGARFHGKIHVNEGKFFLQTKHIDIVRAEMQKEGFVYRPINPGPSAWTKSKEKPAKATRTKEPQQTLRLLPKPEDTQIYATA